jgi:polyhydroxyalkanoate synthesis regulator protein
MKEVGPGPERFEHVMQAVQHLHAAGMHDVAENLQRMAESMRHAMQEHTKHEHAAAQKKPMLEAKPAPQKKPAALNPEIEELRQQMRRLQEQVEKLGAELKKQQAGA